MSAQCRHYAVVLIKLHKTDLKLQSFELKIGIGLLILILRFRLLFTLFVLELKARI